MNKTLLVLPAFALGIALSLTPAHVDAAGRVKARGAHANAEGGATGGRASAVRGPNGGGAVRGRGVVTDGQGNGKAASGSVYRGPSGGTAARAGSTTHQADGSAQHRSGAQWSGANGSGSTQGGFVRDADGTVSGGRQTHADGAQGGQYDADTQYANGTLDRSVDATGRNGNSYEATVNGTKGEGVTRTATCYDANGNAMSCKP
ncbi:MAG: hypothetical protein KA144_09635 [Xanthomonadaceae bacterium]|nr:hypothetical protein [Xanthomonadaceae bacterium]